MHEWAALHSQALHQEGMKCVILQCMQAAVE